MLRMLALLILVTTSFAHAEEPSAIYYRLVTNIESEFYNQQQIESIIKRVIDHNLPSSFVRSYDQEAVYQIVIWTSIMDVENREGNYSGTIFSSHVSIRTYPMIIDAFMPENLSIGITGNQYSTDLIESYFNREVAAVFGQFDAILEELTNFDDGS